MITTFIEEHIIISLSPVLMINISIERTQLMLYPLLIKNIYIDHELISIF